MQLSSESSDQCVAAVLTIQSVWRNQFSLVTSEKVMEAFIKHGPSVQRVKTLSYEALTAYLNDTDMLHVTRKCVRRIHILTVHRHGSPSAAFQPDKLNVCVFMTIYMIAFHSSVFFEEMGTLEQSLLDAATRLLDLFLSICRQLRAHKAFRRVPPETTRHFVPALWDFVKLFHAWKGPDNTKLIGRVRHALLALYNAERRLSPDLPTDSDMRVNFKTHINRLRAKLEELAGVEALRDFDTTRPPTTVPQLPITPLPVQISDDALTHEVLVDPKFQFQVKDLADNSTLPKSCWDMIDAEFRQTPPCYLIAFQIICELKAKLCDLSPAHKSRLEEAVDSGRIRQHVNAGTYRWASCAGLVSSIYAVVRRLCPPGRKQATESAWNEVRQTLASPTALGLKFLSKCVEDLRLDAANERLRLIAPEIKDHGVEYERSRFRDNVDSGVYTLECVTTVLREATDRALEGNATTAEDLKRGLAQAFVPVYLQMIQSLVLVECAPPLLEQHCPETLRFDLERINDLREDFMELTTRAAMLTTLKHAFRSQPAVLDAVIGALGVAETSDEAVVPIMDAVTRLNVPPVARSELLCNLKQCAGSESGVRHLMHSRLKHLIAGGLIDGQLPNSVHLVKTLAELAPRVRDLLGRLFSISDLNYRVHRNTYYQLIRNAVCKK